MSVIRVRKYDTASLSNRPQGLKARHPGVEVRACGPQGVKAHRLRDLFPNGTFWYPKKYFWSRFDGAVLRLSSMASGVSN